MDIYLPIAEVSVNWPLLVLLGALVGFVSASDEDEERLAALIDDTAGRSALDARTQPIGTRESLPEAMHAVISASQEESR